MIWLIFDPMKIIGVLAYITFDQIDISPLPTLIYKLIDHVYLQNKYGAHILNSFDSITILVKLFIVPNMVQITTHWAGTGLKKIFEPKRRIFFFFVEHTSVIKKSFKTEKLNGGFLRKLKKSPKKWPFFEILSRMIFLTHLID